jgi:hypothetical protein
VVVELDFHPTGDLFAAVKRIAQCQLFSGAANSGAGF